MGWVENKSIGFFLPAFTDEFVSSETAKGLEAFGGVVGGDEIVEVS
jgi:hypothetical protein